MRVVLRTVMLWSCIFMVMAAFLNGCGEDITRQFFLDGQGLVLQPPSANAGADMVVGINSTVGLDGSASYDPYGIGLLFMWSQLSGPPVDLYGRNTDKPTFTSGSEIGTQYVFELAATESEEPLLTGTDEVTVTIGTPSGNTPPVANAGPDQAKGPNELVQLNGSGSYDPDGDNLSYIWEQTSGPVVVLNNPTSVTPSFTTTPDYNVAYVFRLTVTDDGNPPLSDTDTVQITVGAPPQVTYTNTTKAIFDAKCILCHPPFMNLDLRTYTTVYAAKQEIKEKVSPDASMRVYLTEQEAQTIIDWIDAGAPE